QVPTWPSIVTGKVTDTHGTPMNDVSVLLESGGVAVLQLSTDSAGLYSSPPIPPGVYNVSAGQSGFVPSVASVTIPEGVPTTAQNFVLERSRPFTISGKVTDTHGTPITGATVTLVENSAIPGILKTLTGATGLYTITMDPGSYNGDYAISATASDFASTSLTMTIPNGATITQNFALV